MANETEILKIRNTSQALYRQGKYKEAIETLKEAWELLPVPREVSVLSNVIAGDIAVSYLEDLQDYEQALVWSDVLALCHQHRADSGEGEFMKGRVYYEMNNQRKQNAFFPLQT